MTKISKIQSFADSQVRVVWDDVEEQYYFSIADTIAILTDQVNSKTASSYWSVLKGRLKKEGASER